MLLPNPIGKGKVPLKQKVKLYEEVSYEKLKQDIANHSDLVEDW